MEVIFLDIDGVLNRNRTYMDKGVHFEEEIISNFNNLLDELNHVKIVISSSWRTDMDELEELMELHGFKHWNRVIGKTPKEGNYRGQQILIYLNNHKEIVKYLVIDDNMMDVYQNLQKKELVKKEFCLEINPDIGLSKKDFEYIKNYFSLL